MANFDKAIQIVLKHEGGFSDHPRDPGGATNMGITFNLFKKYALGLGLKPTVDDLKTLTEDQAKVIYKAEFWDRMKGDDIKSQQVAEIIFDAFVNMGPRALKMLQTEIGVEPDGVFGPVTIGVLNMAAPGVVFNGFKDSRKMYYENLARSNPNLNVFLNGWLNRVNSFKYTA